MLASKKDIIKQLQKNILQWQGINVPRQALPVLEEPACRVCLTLGRPELKQLPFVFAAAEHNRKVITAATAVAESQGIRTGMPVADAKAMVPGLKVFDEKPARSERLLKAIGKWCICYTPIVAIDLPDGLILDISGCAHLWGGEHAT